MLSNIVQSGWIRKIGACRPTYPIRIDSTNEGGGRNSTSLSIPCEDTLSFRKRDEDRLVPLDPCRPPQLSLRRIIHEGLSIFHCGRAEEEDRGRGWPPGLKNERRGRGLISRQKVAPRIRDDLLPPASLRIADSCRGSLSDYFISIRRSAKPRTSFTPSPSRRIVQAPLFLPFVPLSKGYLAARAILSLVLVRETSRSDRGEIDRSVDRVQEIRESFILSSDSKVSRKSIMGHYSVAKA